jgi:hypothetical protein
MPTGTKAIAGPGAQPYLRFPWSWDLGRGWGISGMFTTFHFTRRSDQQALCGIFAVDHEVASAHFSSSNTLVIITSMADQAAL